MKKRWVPVLVLVLAAGSVTALAGQHGNRQEHPMDAERRAKVQERLGLTEEQMRQMREIRQNGGSREDMRAVLTDEQRRMIDEHRRNRAARNGQRDNRDGSPAQATPAEGGPDG